MTLPIFNRRYSEIRALEESVRAAEAQLELAQHQAEANRRTPLVECGGAPPRAWFP